MPKSKRSKVTTLSKTPLRSTKASKHALVQDLQNEIDKYDYVWLFSVGDMRNEGLKEVRGQWRGTGRFYFGKGKVMAKALGITPETEHADQLSLLAKVSTSFLSLTRSRANDSAPEGTCWSLYDLASCRRDSRMVPVMVEEGVRPNGRTCNQRHCFA